MIILRLKKKSLVLPNRLGLNALNSLDTHPQCRHQFGKSRFDLKIKEKVNRKTLQVEARGVKETAVSAGDDLFLLEVRFRVQVYSLGFRGVYSPGFRVVSYPGSRGLYSPGFRGVYSPGFRIYILLGSGVYILQGSGVYILQVLGVYILPGLGLYILQGSGVYILQGSGVYTKYF